MTLIDSKREEKMWPFDKETLEHMQSLHSKIAADIPQLKRGMAWCHRCGYSAPVNSAHALRHGWPLHCGETMSIDSPEERRARKK